jgi:hypothetical protein
VECIPQLDIIAARESPVSVNGAKQILHVVRGPAVVDFFFAATAGVAALAGATLAPALAALSSLALRSLTRSAKSTSKSLLPVVSYLS